MLAAALVFAFLALAQYDADLAAIRQAIGGLNRHAEVYAAENGPAWPEVTAPVLTIHRILFLTPGVATVEGSVVQYGSVIVKRSLPVLLVLRKDARGWRVISYDVGARLRPI